jgi:hypothetical protein
MKKIPLLLVCSLLIAGMAGSAMAGATLTLSKTIVPINPSIPVSVGLTVRADASATGYTLKLDPKILGISAYIVPDASSQIPNIGSALNWITSGSTLTDKTNFTINAIQANVPQNGKLWIKGNSAGNIKMYVYDTRTQALLDEDTLVASGTVSATIPEFPTIALPVAGLLGLMFVFGRKKGDL